jgi:hypothetical protein
LIDTPPNTTATFDFLASSLPSCVRVSPTCTASSPRGHQHQRAQRAFARERVGGRRRC